MPDFVARFPRPGAVPEPPELAAAAHAMREFGLVSNTTIENGGGAAVVLGGTAEHECQFVRSPDNISWVVQKGLMFDVSNDGVDVNLHDLLTRWTAGEIIDWNRFEGTFAMAAWDGTCRRGLAFNDQTSILNLYYCETPRAVYIATAALPLARALGRGLDPAAAREFIARGALIAPRAMFDRFRRLDIGEHLAVKGGGVRVHRHWHYPSEPQPWSLSRAADEAVAVMVDRMKRFAAVAGGTVLTDLTSGYDSRLLSSAAHCAGIPHAVTVHGEPNDEDVRIAKLVARAAGWPMYHTAPDDTWPAISPEMRRELTARTDGNLPFVAMYQQAVMRPGMARHFNLHASGVGGEFIRYHPWGQEFLGIGRRRRANVDNLLRYRFTHDGPPPAALFQRQWYHAFLQDLRWRIHAVCDQLPDSLTTQQLDAVHVWKQTGHSNLYVSAAYNWLPSTTPLMTAGFITVGLSIPWRHRLTARLTRRVTNLLCPAAASVVTRYGGSAGPVRLGNLHRHLYQPLKRVGHLYTKLDRILLGGLTTGRAGGMAPQHQPYLTEEFKSWLDPATMYSREMYDAGGLHALLRGGIDCWYGCEKWILRLATIEQLCHDLDLRPDTGFLLRGVD